MIRLHEMLKLTKLPDFKIVVLITVLLTGIASQDCLADITLPKFFSDHMVLQQNSNFPVWGMAEPNQQLVVRFNDSQRKTVADDKGKFSVSIQTPSAGGPYQLEVLDEEHAAGVILDDVMVGEVWLCAGQSNMNWPVEKSEDAAAELLSANNYNQIRLLTVEVNGSDQPLLDTTKATPWAICSADDIKGFSAVAFFFGRDLAKTLKDVPIGLIDVSCGDSGCEAWISKKSLESVEELAPLLKYWASIESTNDHNRPGAIFNGMVSPLVRYPLRGVIWYQGESNVGRGKQYLKLLEMLVADWRKQFNNDSMPFYMAQLAPHRYGNYSQEALPEVWDAQLKTARTVTNVSLATTMDLGNAANIHPPNKQLVGKRLAMLALAKTYNAQMSASAVNGPLYQSMKVGGDAVRIKFRNAGEGLKNLSPEDSIESFVICGEDQVFHAAKIKEIGKDWVDVVCPEVSSPVAVRYCWTDTAVSHLGNSVNLPAFPFRSDDFKLSTEDLDY